jgi:hypothetical protein
MRHLPILIFLICSLTACNKEYDHLAPVTEESIVEITDLTDAEEAASADDLNETTPGARLSAAKTATTQYIQCKTDDGELYTPSFDFVDFYYGTTKPTAEQLATWNNNSYEDSPADKRGALTVTKTITKGEQLVKSKSFKHGWHVIVPANWNADARGIEIKEGVKGLVNLNWIEGTKYTTDHALLRVSFKYSVTTGIARRVWYMQKAESGKTFAQWYAGSQGELGDDFLIGEASTLDTKSVAIRIPRWKGYVFTYNGNGNVGPVAGKDYDLTPSTRKGISVAFLKKPKKTK